MAYLALYRRFRPDTFDKVIGQEAIIRTLANQIEQNRIGHAYLFCGTRGTGKTSIAKIFAKAVNCEHPVNGSPCNECATCKSFSDAANMDIVEIDAASNNGVDDIRNIREKVQYTPVSGKYKVYIVDEVHMLSIPAFNALLKTLEEPPKHAIFILATTEVHKLPATILSRCMRFDFRLVSAEKITALLEGIFREIGKDFETPALRAIATAAEGSVRDALSIADICVSYADRALTYDDVMDILGASDASKVEGLVLSMLTKDAGAVLETIHELETAGKGMGLLAKDVLACLRKIAVIHSSPKADAILGIPQEVFARLKNIADKTEKETVFYAMDVFSELDANLRYSIQPRVLLEAAALKCANPKNDASLSGLFRRVTELEKMIREGVPTVVAATVAPTLEVKKEETAPIEERIQEAPKSVRSDARDADVVWGKVIRMLRESQSMLLWAQCKKMEVRIEGNELILRMPENERKSFVEKQKTKVIADLVREDGLTVVVEGVPRSNVQNDVVAEVKNLVGEENLKIDE